MKKRLQRSRPSPGHGTELPRAKTGEESTLPEEENELVGLLSDLLSFPIAGGQPEPRPHRPNPYESMSPALRNELHLAPAGPLLESQPDERAVVYENCLKCKGERCQPPPQVVPAEAYWSRNASSSQPLPSGLHLRRCQYRDEELLRAADGQHQYQERHGSVVKEGKRHLTTNQSLVSWNFSLSFVTSSS